jgi:hypothetical protein
METRSKRTVEKLSAWVRYHTFIDANVPKLERRAASIASAASASSRAKIKRGNALTDRTDWMSARSRRSTRMYAFVHIEKTAGSCLNTILRRSFGMRHCDIRLPLAKRRSETCAALPDIM